MTVYDGVVGIDQPALDEFVAAVYHAAHDAVLVGNHPLTPPAFGIASFDWDVASLPVLTLEPSALVRERSLAALTRSGSGTDAERELAADARAQASLGLTVEHLSIGVHYTDPAAPMTHIDALVGGRATSDPGFDPAVAGWLGAEGLAAGTGVLTWPARRRAFVQTS